IKEKHKPPKFAALLLRFLLNHKHPEEMIGDYEEQYNQIAKKKGKQIARLWFWGQVFLAVPPFINNSIFWSFVMFKNNFKITFRSIKKQKAYSFINISGLAVGLACCFLIFMWVQDELSYDNFHKDPGNTFRVISEYKDADKTIYFSRTPGPLAATLRDNYPEVVNSVKFAVQHGGWPVRVGDNFFQNDRILISEHSIFEILSFNFTKGSPQQPFQNNLSIVLSERMAKKYFGPDDPMGRTINIDERNFTVTGVFKFPQNTHLFIVDAVVPLECWGRRTAYEKTWDLSEYRTYVKLNAGSSRENVSMKISELLNTHESKGTSKFHLQPITDINLRSSEIQRDLFGKGNIKYVYIFSVLAFLILVIAIINFVNLSTARSAKRAMEVGLRKVVGANRKDLIKQFLGESMILSLIAFVFAMILISIVLPLYSGFTGKNFSVGNNLELFAGIICITVFTGLISGIYPAFILSNILPVNALKESSMSSPRSSRFRKLFVVGQFSITVFMIIGSVTVFRQLNFIRNKDLGYDKEYLTAVVVRRVSESKINAVKNEILKHPDITGFTMGPLPYSNFFYYPTSDVDWEGKDPSAEALVNVYRVGFDYIETLGMEILKGRSFSREYSTDMGEAYIINEEAQKLFGSEDPVGKQFTLDGRQGKIIGVVKNFHQSTLYDRIEPIVMKIDRFGRILIRTETDKPAMMGCVEYIENIWKRIIPEYPFVYWFIEDNIYDKYKSEFRMGTVSGYFTFLAIFISCLGLLGLVAFTSEQRTKEIGIRKVMGAAVSGIVKLLIKEFVILIVFANIIAWPVTYFFMRSWLNNFAYRTDFDISVYIFSGAFTLIIALITISCQAIKAAYANPVDSLRNE
ncbi:ABC transporter permease, partial [candidate division KSB1 bacterium]